MVWNIAIPLGTESKSLGDDRIRELKADVQLALRANAVEGTESMFPGADTTNPIYRYRGLKGTTGARPAAGQYGLYINETLNTLQRDNGSSWTDIATLIPAGTVMLFYQAAAPVGWTKLTTQNDKVLRIVSGTGGGSGGALATSGTWSHSHAVDSHTHALANHTHSVSGHTHTLDSGTSAGTGSATTNSHLVEGASSIINAITLTGGGTQSGMLKTTMTPVADGTTGAPSDNTSGAAAPGTDSFVSPVLAYIDVIVCSKD